MGKFFVVLSSMAAAFAVALVVPAPVQAAATPTPTSTLSVEAQVRAYFADIPVMIPIAKCESGFREFTANGGVLYGGTGNKMVGIFQIDGTIHFTRAMALGFNINTVAGNNGYARYLYGVSGTAPWISSFGCWGPAMSTGTAGGGTNPSTGTSTPALTMDLALGMINPQVLTLQQLLNRSGYTLTSSGPGSPGSETTKFGAFTRAAVEQFQCARGITCSGDEYTTGYGFVNATTRSALLTLVPSSSTPPVVGTDELAEIAQLKSQIIALQTVVLQLEAAIKAKFGGALSAR